MKLKANEFLNVSDAHILVGKKEDNLILHYKKKVRVDAKTSKHIYWDKTFTIENDFLHIPKNSEKFSSLFIARSVKRILKDLSNIHVYKDGNEIQFIYKNDDFIQYAKSIVCMVERKG